MGITMTFAILGEIVGFTISKRLQGRVGSRRMIVLSFAIRTLWFILIGINRIPLLVLPIQIFGGISFSLIESGSVAYVNERSPGRIGTTAQGVRSAILLRLSSVIGSLIAGGIYQHSGSSRMYGIMAIVSAPPSSWPLSCAALNAAAKGQNLSSSENPGNLPSSITTPYRT